MRLWIDRIFTIKGRGTVVTGTLGAGTIRVGDRLAIGGETVRVRGLQSLKEDHEEVRAVARVAVNLHGSVAETSRGDALLAPGRWLTADVIDVRLRGEPAHDLSRELTLHVGSAAVPVHVRPLGDDTARLVLRRALPLRVGDIALLRDPGAHRVPAGVTVLDVRPPRAVPAARRGGGAGPRTRLDQRTPRRRGRTPPPQADHAGGAGSHGRPRPVRTGRGDWLADPDHWADLRERLVTAVEEHAAAHPTDPGLPADAARRVLGLPTAPSSRPRQPACTSATAGSTGGRPRPNCRRPSSGRSAPSAASWPRRRSRRRTRGSPTSASPRRCSPPRRRPGLLKVGDGIVLLPGDDARAAALLAGLGGPFTLSEARRALGTTRRVAVPLLEHLDGKG